MAEGDPTCDDCGRANIVWFAPNHLWNLVMGGPDATSDPGGFLCPTCFVLRAEESGLVPTGWCLLPEDTVPPWMEECAEEPDPQRYRMIPFS